MTPLFTFVLADGVFQTLKYIHEKSEGAKLKTQDLHYT
jgi:hypothetical protein